MAALFVSTPHLLVVVTYLVSFQVVHWDDELEDQMTSLNLEDSSSLDSDDSNSAAPVIYFQHSPHSATDEDRPALNASDSQSVNHP